VRCGQKPQYKEKEKAGKKNPLRKQNQYPFKKAGLSNLLQTSSGAWRSFSSLFQQLWIHFPDCLPSDESDAHVPGPSRRPFPGTAATRFQHPPHDVHSVWPKKQVRKKNVELVKRQGHAVRKARRI